MFVLIGWDGLVFVEFFRSVNMDVFNCYDLIELVEVMVVGVGVVFVVEEVLFGKDIDVFVWWIEN